MLHRLDNLHKLVQTATVKCKMINKQSVNNIKGLFSTQIEDVPKILMAGERPTYTSLRLFQTVFNKNARAVPSHQSHTLGHPGLTIKEEEYKSLKGNQEW